MIANFYRDPRKDQMTICRALPKVFAEIENAHCVFVGKTEPGAEEKFNDCVRFCRENNIADRVHFLGGRTDIPGRSGFARFIRFFVLAGRFAGRRH